MTKALCFLNCEIKKISGYHLKLIFRWVSRREYATSLSPPDFFLHFNFYVSTSIRCYTKVGFFSGRHPALRECEQVFCFSVQLPNNGNSETLIFRAFVTQSEDKYPALHHPTSEFLICVMNIPLKCSPSGVESGTFASGLVLDADHDDYAHLKDPLVSISGQLWLQSILHVYLRVHREGSPPATQCAIQVKVHHQSRRDLRSESYAGGESRRSD